MASSFHARTDRECEAKQLLLKPLVVYLEKSRMCQNKYSIQCVRKSCCVLYPTCGHLASCTLFMWDTKPSHSWCSTYWLVLCPFGTCFFCLCEHQHFRGAKIWVMLWCLEKDDSYGKSPKRGKNSFWTAEIRMNQTQKCLKWDNDDTRLYLGKPHIWLFNDSTQAEPPEEMSSLSLSEKPTLAVARRLTEPTEPHLRLQCVSDLTMLNLDCISLRVMHLVQTEPLAFVGKHFFFFFPKRRASRAVFGELPVIRKGRPEIPAGQSSLWSHRPALQGGRL